MNLLVFFAIVAGMVALRVVDLRVRKLHILVWVAAWLVAAYLGMRFAIQPSVPSFVLWMFMGILVLVLLTYVTASTERLMEARDATVSFMADSKYKIPLVVVVLLLPLLVALNVYFDLSSSPQPPVSGRTIHPPPPGQISFKGQTINLTTAVNPYRALEETNEAEFARHVENGRRVYYENCHFCHGDNLRGNGQYAHGFDPIPANLADAQTIGILQESYLFWRIAKGGPGLPEEATPWSSAMPAWEYFLTEDEIWDVILFLYDFTDLRPRAKDAEEESALAE